MKEKVILVQHFKIFSIETQINFSGKLIAQRWENGNIFELKKFIANILL